LHERDDDVGKEIANYVPDTPVLWNAWLKEMLEYLDKRVRVVLDLRKEENEVR
jgi:hypothetical protein